MHLMTSSFAGGEVGGAVDARHVTLTAAHLTAQRHGTMLCVYRSALLLLALR